MFIRSCRACAQCFIHALNALALHVPPVLCVHLIRSMLAALGSGGRFVRCPRLRGRVRHPEGCAARQQRDQRHGERRRMRGDVCLFFCAPSIVYPWPQAPGAPLRRARVGGARGVHVRGPRHREHNERDGRHGVSEARHMLFARVYFCSAYAYFPRMARNNSNRKDAVSKHTARAAPSR